MKLTLIDTLLQRWPAPAHGPQLFGTSSEARGGFRELVEQCDFPFLLELRIRLQLPEEIFQIWTLLSGANPPRALATISMPLHTLDFSVLYLQAEDLLATFALVRYQA